MKRTIKKIDGYTITIENNDVVIDNGYNTNFGIFYFRAIDKVLSHEKTVKGYLANYWRYPQLYGFETAFGQTTKVKEYILNLIFTKQLKEV